MFANIIRRRMNSSSSSSSSGSSSTDSRRPGFVSRLLRKKDQDSVPIETVRKLLMGNADPVELAMEILPRSDLAAVVRYNSAPYRPPLDLDSYAIATAEDILFVGLTYAGFDGPRQNRKHIIMWNDFVLIIRCAPRQFWTHGITSMTTEMIALNCGCYSFH